MTTVTKIEKTNIIRTVMEAIRSAREEILATMDLSEEIRNPLPREYFLLLNKKLCEGIKINRLAFGTKTDFKTIEERYNTESKGYSYFLAKTENYKRMILIDKKKLFFAEEKDGQRTFFFTSDKAQVKKFSHYFEKELAITQNRGHLTEKE